MKRYMRGIVVMGPGKVEIVDDIPVPKPGDYDALVKVKSCGICSGTDLQYIDGTEKETLADYPTILGHESAGEVIAIGKKVRHIQVGDRFIHTNLRENTESRYTKTHGSMAEYGLVPDVKSIMEDGYSIEQIPEITGYGRRVYTYQDGPEVNGRLEADMDLVEAGVFQPLAESLSAVINFGVKEEDSVLIYGCGPMGLAAALFCKLRGARFVAVVDKIAERLRQAEITAHADLTIDLTREEMGKVLNGKLFDIVIDAVGSSQILLEGSRYCKCNGTVGAMGVLKKDDCILDVQSIKNSVRLHMLNFPYHSFASLDLLQRMIREGKVNPKDFISHVIPMQEVNKGIAMIRNRQAFKVVLTF